MVLADSEDRKVHLPQGKTEIEKGTLNTELAKANTPAPLAVKWNDWCTPGMGVN